ncbi:MAG: clan AA aspartic protease [Bacteroidota bacterium]
MGLVYTEIELANLLAPELQSYKVKALVDTGALHLCIPQHIAVQLKLKQLEEREVTIADGSKRVIPYVGPVKVTFQNRNCFTGAMVIGDEVLLGAIPMEDMDLVVHPSRLLVTANPESPNIPASVVK